MELPPLPEDFSIRREDEYWLVEADGHGTYPDTIPPNLGFQYVQREIRRKKLEEMLRQMGAKEGETVVIHDKPLKSSRTGLLAGVFDPVHIGHMFMAYLAMKPLILTGFGCPTHIPPHKDNAKVPYFHRVNMLEMALNEEPNLCSWNWKEKPDPHIHMKPFCQ